MLTNAQNKLLTYSDNWESYVGVATEQSNDTLFNSRAEKVRDRVNRYALESLLYCLFLS
jgi:hypothetical protein